MIARKEGINWCLGGRGFVLFSWGIARSNGPDVASKRAWDTKFTSHLLVRKSHVSVYQMQSRDGL